MFDIRKTYIKNKPLAVQVDIKILNTSKEYLKIMHWANFEENDPEDVLSVAEAREFNLKLRGEK